jgi:hypothetical protein
MEGTHHNITTNHHHHHHDDDHKLVNEIQTNNYVMYYDTHGSHSLARIYLRASMIRARDTKEQARARVHENENYPTKILDDTHHQS